MTIAENSEIRVFELLGVFDFTWTALISVHKKTDWRKYYYIILLRLRLLERHSHQHNHDNRLTTLYISISQVRGHHSPNQGSHRV